MRVDMNRFDADANMDRFYSAQLTRSLFGEVRVEPQWGRQGILGRYRLDWCKKEAKAAADFFEFHKKFDFLVQKQERDDFENFLCSY